MIAIPPHIARHVEAIREFCRLNRLPALVIPVVGEAAAVEPLILCPHCRLPVGEGGPHGACDQSARERYERC